MVARLALLLLLVGTAQAQTPSDKLLGALKAFESGIETQRENPIGAANLYQEAVDGFAALRSDGYANAPLFLNLGNAHFQLGQTGLAIACYRRAAEYEPGNTAVQSNLDYARLRVEPRIQPGDEAELLARILFWQYGTTRSTRLWATLLLGLLGWGALGIWLRYRHQPLLVIGAIGASLALLSGVSLGWELQQRSLHPDGVVVHDATVLRLGRGEGYDAALNQPLGPGVEVRIEQQRGDWYEVRLVDGTLGWLPGDRVQRIDEL